MANLFSQKRLPECCLWILLLSAGILWNLEVQPLSTPCTVCAQYPAFPLGEAQEGRGESSFQGSACPTKKAQLNADRNKSCSRKDVLSSIPSERTEWAGFDRARRESGSSKLDRNSGSYFLPTFGGSQLLSYLEPSQKHTYPAVQSCFSQPL